MSDKPVFLTAERAKAMLPDDETVHTFRDAGVALFGCDWERHDLLQAIENHKCELGGAGCQAINHGLVIWTDNRNPLFVECRQGTDYAAIEQEVRGD